ncbi:hypothetical protein LOTGIDRAFT_175688 [Lottia gigantea]|uniref:Uncharacterized protein n=1 Tax=Lottia gigantea TaxID=225164 RepID=V4BU24_LOTGI|nr:hypothetical protein LOTGIDRAFT_175688 [Lottia gigantea]ESO92494.1 hypothetical protein LOTGIDRAFT_175688 [Lottia gigantea]
MAEQDDEIFELRSRNNSSSRSLRNRNRDNNPTFSFSSDSEDETPLDETDQPKSVSFPKETRNNSNLLQSDPKYDTIQSNVSRESSSAMLGCYDMWINGDIQFVVVGGNVDSKAKEDTGGPKV